MACLWSFPLNSNLILHRSNFWKVAKKPLRIGIVACIMHAVQMQNFWPAFLIFLAILENWYPMQNIFRHCVTETNPCHIYLILSQSVCVCWILQKTKFKYKHSFIFCHSVIIHTWMPYSLRPMKQFNAMVTKTPPHPHPKTFKCAEFNDVYSWISCTMHLYSVQCAVYLFFAWI